MVRFAFLLAKCALASERALLRRHARAKAGLARSTRFLGHSLSRNDSVHCSYNAVSARWRVVSVCCYTTTTKALVGPKPVLCVQKKKKCVVRERKYGARSRWALVPPAHGEGRRTAGARWFAARAAELREQRRTYARATMLSKETWVFGHYKLTSSTKKKNWAVGLPGLEAETGVATARASRLYLVTRPAARHFTSNVISQRMMGWHRCCSRTPPAHPRLCFLFAAPDVSST